MTLTKAWHVIAYILDGGVYCTDCAQERALDIFDARPIFASDDYSGMSCDDCRELLGEIL